MAASVNQAEQLLLEVLSETWCPTQSAVPCSKGFELLPTSDLMFRVTGTFIPIEDYLVKNGLCLSFNSIIA